MDFIERLKKIKQIFESVDTAVEYKLADGRVLKISNLDIDGEVWLDGVYAADGDYTLEDGGVISVTDGRILAYNKPAATKVEVDMAVYKLVDGTEVEISELAEGGMVKVGGENAPAGEHTLEDGTKITVGAEGKIIKVEVAGVVVDAPLQMQDAREVMQKFATGTPEERLANLEVVAKAVMEYCFGWQIREQQVKADSDAAIAVYKQGFSAKETELAELKKQLETQKEVITQLFELVEKIGEQPTDNPPPQRKRIFSAEVPGAKKSVVARYAEALQKSREN